MANYASICRSSDCIRRKEHFRRDVIMSYRVAGWTVALSLKVALVVHIVSRLLGPGA